jgi:hypothetical protein
MGFVLDKAALGQVLFLVLSLFVAIVIPAVNAPFNHPVQVQEMYLLLFYQGTPFTTRVNISQNFV